jgi:hypothetical protein
MQVRAAAERSLPVVLQPNPLVSTALATLPPLSPAPAAPAGTTTTAESLFMGVPVITLAGRCHAHNVSASLLSAIGLAEQWVAADAEQYVQLAIRHASNVSALVQLRSQMRQQMLGSRLCDAAPFTASLEGLYEQMWQRWVEQGGRKATHLQLAGASAGQGQVQQPQQQQPRQQQQLAVVGQPAAAAAATAPSAPDAVKAAAADGCGSRKGSRAPKHGASSTDAAAAPAHEAPQEAAGAAASPGGCAGSGGACQKGRKLAASCDAAATVHSGAVTMY